MASNPITAAEIISVVHAAADLIQTSYTYASDGDGWTEYLKELSALIALLFRIEHAVLDMDITELLPSHSNSMDQNFLSDIHAQFVRMHSKLQVLNADNLAFQISEWQEDIEALRKLQTAFSDLISSSVMCSVSTSEAPEVRISRMAATEVISDIQEWSPLFGACFTGDLDRVRQLLSSNENYHIHTKFGWTVLHWAIIGESLEVVQEIFEHHAQSHDLVNPIRRMKATELLSYFQAVLPVTLAMKVQHIDIFNLVVQHLENPDGHKEVLLNRVWGEGEYKVKIYGLPSNPWRSMTRWGRVHCFRLQSLIPGTHIPTTNPEAIQSRPVEWIKWTSSLLRDAIRDQKFSMVQMLIRAGTDVNYGYRLHEASLREDPRYVKVLLAGGADPRVINKITGRTALSEAILNGFVETAAALIDGGADVNHALCPPSSGDRVGYIERLSIRGHYIELGNQGATSLMLACGFHFYQERQVTKTNAIGAPQPPETALELFRLLLARGADPTMTDSQGRTVLHYAALRPSSKLIELLVESGCLIEAVDREGRTPLQYLALCNEERYETDELEKAARLLSGHQSSSLLAKDLLNHPVLRPVASEEDGDSEDLQPPFKKARYSHLLPVVRQSNGISCDEEKNDEARTPILSALLAKRWKVVRILADLGATRPSKLDLEATPILDQVIEALEPQILDLILGQGIIPSAGSIFALVQSFISHRLDPKAAEDTNHTDLYAKFHHMLAALVSGGADINYRETSEEAVTGTTPMVLAATIPGSRQILPALLASGGDLYAPSTQYFDALRAAMVYGEPADLSFLVAHALRHPNTSHWSHQLAQTPEEDNLLAQICSCLHDAGLLDSTNHHGRTLLHLAAEQDHTSLLAALLIHNASPNIRDQEDYLALHRAGFAKHAQAFTQLLPSSLLSSSSSSLLDLLLSPVDKKDRVNLIDHAFLHRATPFITTLLQHGLSPNHTVHFCHSDPKPALYFAASRNAHDLVTLLLDSGADPNAPDPFGWQPLHVASLHGYSAIFSALLAAGADIHAHTRSWNTSATRPTGLYAGNAWHGTPLHLAAMGGHVGLVTTLLARGADVHAETGTGRMGLYFMPGHGPTALHLALDTDTFYGRPNAEEGGRVQVAGILVSAGARARGLLGHPKLSRAVELAKVPGLWDALVEAEVEARWDCDLMLEL